VGSTSICREQALTRSVGQHRPGEAGFTLFEVVLAIGLCGAVMALLATAIDLYLVRVDTSRTQVETAQLARTLLNKIADDLRASIAAPSEAGGRSWCPPRN
jgi:hypothetical protein